MYRSEGDGVNVTCIVDNAVQRSSKFWGEHGVAFLIETEDGRVLFDTGQSGAVLLHNLDVLGVDVVTLDGLIISHAHYDHTGGLAALLERLRPGIPLYASPELFRERFSRRGKTTRSIGLVLTKEDLGVRLGLQLSAKPQEVMPGVRTTGEIQSRPEPEGSSSHHWMREGNGLVQDAYRDDMGVVLKVDGGLAVLCGCCHAGLLNTLEHVRRMFAQPIVAVAGGLHLNSVPPEQIRRVVEVLKGMESVRCVYPNHCTGETAFLALTQALGSSVVRPCPVGTVIEW